MIYEVCVKSNREKIEDKHVAAKNEGLPDFDLVDDEVS